jgi:hypothetical protein
MYPEYHAVPLGQNIISYRDSRAHSEVRAKYIWLVLDLRFAEESSAGAILTRGFLPESNKPMRCVSTCAEMTRLLIQNQMAKARSEVRREVHATQVVLGARVRAEDVGYGKLTSRAYMSWTPASWRTRGESSGARPIRAPRLPIARQ